MLYRDTLCPGFSVRGNIDVMVNFLDNLSLRVYTKNME